MTTFFISARKALSIFVISFAFYPSMSTAQGFISESLVQGMIYPQSESIDAAVSFKESMAGDLEVILDQPWRHKELVSPSESKIYYSNQKAAVVGSNLYLFYVESDRNKNLRTIYEHNLTTGERYKVYSTSDYYLTYYTVGMEIIGDTYVFAADDNDSQFFCYDIGTSSPLYDCDMQPQRAAAIETLDSPDGRYLVMSRYHSSELLDIDFDELDEKLSTWKARYLSAIQSHEKVVESGSDIYNGSSSVMLNDYTTNTSSLLFIVGYVDFIIGQFEWSDDSTKFYFDNSGGFACIWEYDIENKRLHKIVPEHEAKYPYYLNIEGREFIFYREGAKIMVATP
ncbi:hypothetical protein [Reinekea thalattae]|uniref:WD40 repeat domain-containing protein n=1 Tax=Reinekea thalattae TaxID=2593301 RepID=A0A5C8ZAV5_9GAMM|nr:hypothetical protein [Reinekea thalattae]TXR54318.1 hypothetical protein FME95_07215 [Reinekea thalattae]